MVKNETAVPLQSRSDQFEDENGKLENKEIKFESNSPQMQRPKITPKSKKPEEEKDFFKELEFIDQLKPKEEQKKDEQEMQKTQSEKIEGEVDEKRDEIEQIFDGSIFEKMEKDIEENLQILTSLNQSDDEKEIEQILSDDQQNPIESEEVKKGLSIKAVKKRVEEKPEALLFSSKRLEDSIHSSCPLIKLGKNSENTSRSSLDFSSISENQRDTVHVKIFYIFLFLSSLQKTNYERKFQ